MENPSRSTEPTSYCHFNKQVLRPPVESGLPTLVGMEDHLGDRLSAAADGDRHLQRRAGQVDVMVLIQGEPHDPAGANVEDTVQVQLALIGWDLGAVTEPHLVDCRRAELSSDQV